MNQQAVAPIVIVVILMTTTVGMIIVYSTMADPLERFKDFILDRMDAHTGPIENFWRVFEIAGILLIGATILWAYLRMTEDDYSRKRRVPRGRLSSLS